MNDTLFVTTPIIGPTSTAPPIKTSDNMKIQKKTETAYPLRTAEERDIHREMAKIVVNYKPPHTVGG
jgi:hypothetical protein